METVTKIRESICMLSPAALSDYVQKKKAKGRKPIGDKKITKKSSIHVKGKGKGRAEEVSDDNEDSD